MLIIPRAISYGPIANNIATSFAEFQDFQWMIRQAYERAL